MAILIRSIFLFSAVLSMGALESSHRALQTTGELAMQITMTIDGRPADPDAFEVIDVGVPVTYTWTLVNADPDDRWEECWVERSRHYLTIDSIAPTGTPLVNDPSVYAFPPETRSVTITFHATVRSTMEDPLPLMRTFGCIARDATTGQAVWAHGSFRYAGESPAYPPADQRQYLPLILQTNPAVSEDR